MKKPWIVLDWDGVLFDFKHHHAMVVDRLEALTSLPIDTIEQIYIDSKDRNGYNDKRLAEAIAVESGHNSAVVLGQIHSALEQKEESHIFPDALSTLIELTKLYRIVILTAGNDRIQRHKIQASGLEEYIDQIVVVPGDTTEINKEKALADLLANDQPLAFFDDRLSTILHLHEVFRDNSNLIPIWINRDDPEPVSPITFNSLSMECINSGVALLGTPRGLSAAVRVAKDDRVIMVLEQGGRGDGMWSLPVGHVDPDEMFLAAAAREAEEETGYGVEIHDIRALIAVDGDPYLGGRSDLGRTIIIACFDATLESDDKIGEAELETRWVSNDEFATLPIRGDWQKKLIL